MGVVLAERGLDDICGCVTFDQRLDRREHEMRPGFGEDGRALLLGEAGVERHEDGPQLGERGEERHGGEGRLAPPRHPPAVLDPLAAQRTGDRVRLRVQLREGEHVVAQ